MVELETW